MLKAVPYVVYAFTIVVAISGLGHFTGNKSEVYLPPDLPIASKQNAGELPSPKQSKIRPSWSFVAFLIS